MPSRASTAGPTELLANVALLGRVDTLDALRALATLDCRLCQMDGLHSGPDLDAIYEAWDRARVLRRSLYGAVAQGDRAGLVSRVTTLLAEENLMDPDDTAPRELLEALGRDGRQEVLLRLTDTREEREMGSWTDSLRLTELLLAEPTAGDMLEVVARLGIQALVSPAPVLRRLLVETASDEDVLEWMRRALAEGAGEEDVDARPDRLATVACEAEGRLELAQQIRLVAFEALLDPEPLRDRLERLPNLERIGELVWAMQLVRNDERRTQALLFLMAWPDLEAAGQLVRRHHATMVGVNCGAFSEVAARLETVDPVAALLLYRQAAFCQFTTGLGLYDTGPRFDRCEALWTRHQDSGIESHNAFLDRLHEDTSSWR